MRSILSACTLVIASAVILPAPAMAGFTAEPPEGVLCDKKSVGNGLVKGNDLSQLLAIMSNRCSNAGVGNGGESASTDANYPGIYTNTPKEAGDVDPGNSGNRNKAAKNDK